MSESSAAPSGNVIVSAERLAELERLERELPTIIAKAKEEANKERFDKLHQRDKENPGAACQRALKYYEQHKEEINAKRREKYKMKKAESKTAETPGV